MIVGVGTDIVSNFRVGRLYRKFGRKFLGKYLTEVEIGSLKSISPEHLGGLFALKEAIVKCLSTVVASANYHSAEIIYQEKSLRPIIRLVDTNLNNSRFVVHVSIAHEKDYSVAFAVMEKTNK